MQGLRYANIARDVLQVWAMPELCPKAEHQGEIVRLLHHCRNGGEAPSHFQPSNQTMKYEYGTVWVFAGNDSESFAKAVELEINRMATAGWEYVDSINNGSLYGAVLVFRRAK